ncbi:hypothetical protein J8I87_31195 [Paraburkholderia sp. LEh10]|jgi:hypothetical protein|uniref:hypothetical protein n=1 Tax=Paraburkholderia sp. LEh10 TaxID=2821353 RepID=UPI001AE6EF8A|nr:hypothetical protein [Paraburkholderia sp. LEh10]MBP0594065.1 hypothetical protein [Paraburkholderia sp. LEh10]
MQTDPTIDPVADPANQPIDDPGQQPRPAPGLPPDMDPLAPTPSPEEKESVRRSAQHDDRASFT